MINHEEEKVIAHSKGMLKEWSASQPKPIQDAVAIMIAGYDVRTADLAKLTQEHETHVQATDKTLETMRKVHTVLAERVGKIDDPTTLREISFRKATLTK